MRVGREWLDLTVYVRALGVFVKNPIVIVLPLLASVIAILANQAVEPGAPLPPYLPLLIVGGVSPDRLTGGIISFIVQLIALFAMGGSIIIADTAWRRGHAKFDDSWQEARRRGGDILFAAFGITFVFSIAWYAGTIIGGLGMILLALAAYGLIYAIPAAAIGGIPGGAAIGASIDRVRGAPLTAAILVVMTTLIVFFGGAFVATAIDDAIVGLGADVSVLPALIGALIQSITMGYIAIVMARVYADVAFTMPRW